MKTIIILIVVLMLSGCVIRTFPNNQTADSDRVTIVETDF